MPALRRARNPLCAYLSAEGGLRGNPRRGFPLFFWFLRVRRYVGRWSMACPAIRPHFFGACPKKRCRAAKEKRFFYPGGSTIRVSATSRWTIRSSPDFGEGLVRLFSARSANESFVHLFKGGGVQGQSPCPRSAECGTLLCLFKRRRGSKGEPSPGVPPFLYVCACAPIRWGVVVTLSCRSTPFLWCLPKETVSSRQRKALFYPGCSTIRVSATASVDYTFLARLGEGGVLTGAYVHPLYLRL